MMQQFTSEDFRKAYRELPETYRVQMLGQVARSKQETFAETAGIQGEQREQFFTLLDAAAYRLIDTTVLQTHLSKELGLDAEAATKAVTLFNTMADQAEKGLLDSEPSDDSMRSENSNNEQYVQSRRDLVRIIRALRKEKEAGTFFTKLVNTLANELEDLPHISDVAAMHVLTEVVSFRLQAMGGKLKDLVARGTYKSTVEDGCKQWDIEAQAAPTIEEEVLMVLLALNSIENFRKELAMQFPNTKTPNIEMLADYLVENLFKDLTSQLQVDEIDDNISEASETTPAQGTQSPLEQFLKKDTDVQARFEKLPESVRTAMLSPEVAAQFSTIVREHAMEQEAFMTFGAHVVRVLAGLENVNELRTTLREKKIIAHEEVEPVAQKVEAGMVKPVRDAIVKEVEQRKAAK